MIDQGTVDRNKLKTLDFALSEEQSVKGIPGGRFGIDGVEDVRDFNPKYLQAN